MSHDEQNGDEAVRITSVRTASQHGLILYLPSDSNLLQKISPFLPPSRDDHDESDYHPESNHSRQNGYPRATPLSNARRGPGRLRMQSSVLPTTVLVSLLNVGILWFMMFYLEHDSFLFSSTERDLSKQRPEPHVGSSSSPMAGLDDRSLSRRDEPVGDSTMSTSLPDQVTQDYPPTNNDTDLSTSLYSYQSVEEMNQRSLRFPSVEERVRLYMSYWYAPPCDSSDLIPYHFYDPQEVSSWLGDRFWQDEKDREAENDFPILVLQEPSSAYSPSDMLEEKARAAVRATVAVRRKPDPARLIYYHEATFTTCSGMTTRLYCDDLQKNLIPIMERRGHESRLGQSSISAGPPVLMQFGDRVVPEVFVPAMGKNDDMTAFPYLSKVRYALSPETLDQMTNSQACRKSRSDMKGVESAFTYPPLLWKLTSERHLGSIPDIPRNDRPWHEKRNGVVFRGATTGLQHLRLGDRKLSEISPADRCEIMPRCVLVSKYHQYFREEEESDSSATSIESPSESDGLPFEINVRLTRTFFKKKGGLQDNKYGFPDEYFGRSMNFEQMLQYKAIIILEGNDVATGLKWALYSNSVVMTTAAQLVSWAMEERLEPWVHYIPLEDDFSDLPEKVQWMVDHDDEASAIAHRGQLWIQDLLFHPDAAADEQAIFEETIRRYQAHFVQKPNLLSLDEQLAASS